MLKALRYADLRSKGVTFSRIHLNRLIKAGEFPRPFLLGERSLAWDERTIDEWLLGRMKIPAHLRRAAQIPKPAKQRRALPPLE
jgi:prophage regulatory protein